MYSRRLKNVYFALEGMNAFATGYYFYYLFFFLRDHFGFGNKENLAACALSGFFYMTAAFLGGRFSQRAGYFAALRLGFALMAASLLTACFVPGSLGGELALMVAWTIGMSLTWPALEALTSERETPARLQHVIGIYNIVWATGSALAYFSGGVLMEKLGARSVFWLPALLHGLQLSVVLVVRHRLSAAPAPSAGVPAAAESARAPAKEPTPEHAERPARPAPTLSPRTFLRMAWLANPFAYVAINAAVPVIPDLARRLHLTTERAGFFCSIWFFARLATFILLWRWTGWHYRFRWLVTAFGLMIASFATMLLAPSLAVVALAQIVFGYGLGLIYYSSLFYSMDVGDTKGEHGGIHESAIGCGLFGGAAIGAAGQSLLNGQTSSTWVVSAVLVLGLAALFWIRQRGLGKKD